MTYSNAAGHVRVFVVEANRCDNAKVFRLLNDEERARADSFRKPSDACDNAVAHALKRIVIAKACGSDPAFLRFARDENGKPYLMGADWHFNLSHSQGICALAISKTGECGVDIEAHRARPGFDALVASAMTAAECACIAAAPVPESAFYQRWVMKEALVKASGIGLRADFRSLCTIRDLTVSGELSGMIAGASLRWWNGHGFSLAACHGGGPAQFTLSEDYAELG